MSQPGSRGVRFSRAARAGAATDVAGILADLDTQLMLEVRAGNREAANALIRRNRERIARYIARLIGSVGPAEDLTQDVFLQAFRHAAQYQPTARVLTWLYSIATNVVRNYIKGAERRGAAASAEGEALDVADDDEPTPERRLSLDELREQVAHAVNDLPMNQRIALTLFEYEDCTYEQIAAVLGVSVEAVRSLLMRARTRLRGRLRGVI